MLRDDPSNWVETKGLNQLGSRARETRRRSCEEEKARRNGSHLVRVDEEEDEKCPKRLRRVIGRENEMVSLGDREDASSFFCLDDM